MTLPVEHYEAMPTTEHDRILNAALQAPVGNAAARWLEKIRRDEPEASRGRTRAPEALGA
jgi:hypothetical protein